MDDLDALVVVFGALLIADDKVVDGVAVLTADGADRTGLGQGRCNVARQEGAFVLGVGDVQQVLHRVFGCIVDPDPLHVGIAGCNRLDLVELPADAHHHIGGVSGVAHLRGVVFVVALHSHHVDAKVSLEPVGARFGGVIEGAVAKGARHHQRKLELIAGGLIILLAARKQAHKQKQHQNACKQSFHCIASFCPTRDHHFCEDRPIII